MSTHSSILAWRIPWTEEPGGLLSMGLRELEDSQDWEPGGRGRLGLDHDGAVEGEEVGGSGRRGRVQDEAWALV